MTEYDDENYEDLYSCYLINCLLNNHCDVDILLKKYDIIYDLANKTIKPHSILWMLVIRI